jgi:4-alpha-glucanotransferase
MALKHIQASTNPLTDRRAGVLLHPTSLPDSRDQGSLGPDARRFIDFLQAAGFTVWQVLPLGPTHSDRSPYQCLSVHAGDEQLINLEDLVTRGWLKAASSSSADFYNCLAAVHEGFEKSARPAEHAAYNAFKLENAYWLEDYALYRAVRKSLGNASWYHWPVPLRDREAAALRKFARAQEKVIEQVCFEQYLFFLQWFDLRSYAHAHGVCLFGDMPIYVAYDSADVWANRELFTLDEHGGLEVVAGVPPDYFSATGQRWGNPLYRWDRIREKDYRWWLDRMRTQLELFDIIRLDHFRGFEKYWEIPASCDTAIDGRWVEGPGTGLFDRLQQEFGELPLVAEDLGIITPEVDALRLQYGFPGMKILQFAFDGGEDNPYLPQNHEPLSVVYTGTHDNDTTLGWYRGLDEHTRYIVTEYLQQPMDDMPWPMIHTALKSDARLAIIPMQDLLALGTEDRMNIPGSSTDNWRWRFDWEQVAPGLARELHDLVRRYGRDDARPPQQRGKQSCYTQMMHPDTENCD